MPKATTNINIRISEEDKELLQTLANKEGRTMANMIIYLIRKEAQRGGLDIGTN